MDVINWQVLRAKTIKEASLNEIRKKTVMHGIISNREYWYPLKSERREKKKLNVMCKKYFSAIGGLHSFSLIRFFWLMFPSLSTFARLFFGCRKAILLTKFFIFFGASYVYNIQFFFSLLATFSWNCLRLHILCMSIFYSQTLATFLFEHWLQYKYTYFFVRFCYFFFLRIDDVSLLLSKLFSNGIAINQKKNFYTTNRMDYLLCDTSIHGFHSQKQCFFHSLSFNDPWSKWRRADKMKNF